LVAELLSRPDIKGLKENLKTKPRVYYIGLEEVPL
jgi:hypothetical protein